MQHLLSYLYICAKIEILTYVRTNIILIILEVNNIMQYTATLDKPIILYEDIYFDGVVRVFQAQNDIG